MSVATAEVNGTARITANPPNSTPTAGERARRRGTRLDEADEQPVSQAEDGFTGAFQPARLIRAGHRRRR